MLGDCMLCGACGRAQYGDLCYDCNERVRAAKVNLFAMGWRPTDGNPVDLLQSIKTQLEEINARLAGNYGAIKIEGDVTSYDPR